MKHWHEDFGDELKAWDGAAKNDDLMIDPNIGMWIKELEEGQRKVNESWLFFDNFVFTVVTILYSLLAYLVWRIVRG